MILLFRSVLPKRILSLPSKKQKLSLKRPMQKQKIKDIAKYFNYNKTDKKNNEMVLFFFLLE
jgi:hypothetical protein